MNKLAAEAKEEQTRLQRLNSELAIIERDITQAQAAHSSTALNLAESPNDARLQDECSGLEDEIEQLERKRTRLQIALAEVVRLDSREAKEISYALLKELAAQIEQRMARQGELAAKVVEILGSISPVVMEFDTLGQENHADLWTACKLGCDDLKTTERHASPLLHMVAGHHALPAFVEALRRSGVVYPQMRPHVHVASTGYEGNLHNDTVMATDNVSRKLAHLITRREAELYGDPAAAVAVRGRGAGLAKAVERRLKGKA